VTPALAGLCGRRVTAR